MTQPLILFFPSPCICSFLWATIKALIDTAKYFRSCIFKCKMEVFFRQAFLPLFIYLSSRPETNARCALAGSVHHSLSGFEKKKEKSTFLECVCYFSRPLLFLQHSRDWADGHFGQHRRGAEGQCPTSLPTPTPPSTNPLLHSVPANFLSGPPFHPPGVSEERAAPYDNLYTPLFSSNTQTGHSTVYCDVQLWERRTDILGHF